jgi:hypothetical protein
MSSELETVSSTDLKSLLGRRLRNLHQPVGITVHGNIVAYIVSREVFEDAMSRAKQSLIGELKQLRDHTLSAEESIRILDQLLDNDIPELYRRRESLKLQLELERERQDLLSEQESAELIDRSKDELLVRQLRRLRSQPMLSVSESIDLLTRLRKDAEEQGAITPSDGSVEPSLA